MNNNIEILAVAPYLRPHDLAHRLHGLLQRNDFHLQGHLPALDLGHIQDIIDQTE